MSTLALYLFIVLLGLDLGAGIYESRIVVPLWAGGVPDTLGDGHPYARVAIDAGMRFWKYLTSLVALISIVTLAFSFTAPPARRAWQLAASCIELAVIASTLLYFRPVLVRLFMGHGDGLSTDAIAATVHRWVFWSRLRVLVSFIAWFAALGALAHR